jgi:hypothetical protein
MGTKLQELSPCMKISKREVEAELKHLQDYLNEFGSNGAVCRDKYGKFLYLTSGVIRTIDLLRRLETFLLSIVHRTDGKILKNEVQEELNNLKEYFNRFKYGHVSIYDATFSLFSFEGAEDQITQLRRLETFLNSIVNRTEV